MADAPATDPWTLTFSGEPPAHFMSDDEMSIAVGVPLVYEDLNGNNAFDMSDMFQQTSSLYAVCYDDGSGAAPLVVSAVYTPAVTDFATAMGAGMYGFSSGWSLMASSNDTPIFLSESDSRFDH